MTVENEVKAQQYLRRIGYYRMSAYFYPLLAMPKEDHKYKVGSTFRQESRQNLAGSLFEACSRQESRLNMAESLFGARFRQESR